MSRKLGKQDVLTHNPSTKHEQNRVPDEDEDMDLTCSPSKHDADDLGKDKEMDLTSRSSKGP
jgi:hypothetical protein